VVTLDYEKCLLIKHYNNKSENINITFRCWRHLPFILSFRFKHWHVHYYSTSHTCSLYVPSASSSLI